MSGWGCRHQLDDRCLLLRKECKPGIPGCVLYRKVNFISEVERRPRRQAPRSGRITSPAKRESICVPFQAGSAGDQREYERTMALRIVRSLCMQATMATLGSFPALIRSWKALITGLC